MLLPLELSWRIAKNNFFSNLFRFFPHFLSFWLDSCFCIYNCPGELPKTFFPRALVVFFPNSVSLGSSAIVKVPEQVGAAKSAGNRVPRKVPRKSFLFQENPSEQPDPHGARLGTGLRGRGSQARLPGRGSQARFPSKVPRNRFPRKVPKRFQEQVPKQGFPARGFQARFPGSQARFPWKRFPARFPARY